MASLARSYSRSKSLIVRCRFGRDRRREEACWLDVGEVRDSSEESSRFFSARVDLFARSSARSSATLSLSDWIRSKSRATERLSLVAMLC